MQTTTPYDFTPRTISITGLGYIGLPLAVALAKHFKIIGFDKNHERIEQLKVGIDETKEIDNDALTNNSNLHFTSQDDILCEANFHIIAVPTPIDDTKQPDLTLLIEATKTIGHCLKRGDIVVYESTVYPGVTEEVCLPILEKHSNLTCGIDFSIGYSPERINPGDKIHTLDTIIKVISGFDQPTLEIIESVYSQVTKAGVYKAPNIKTAEAAKIIENVQRDINIALMNELALIFDKLNIDTQEVLKTAQTKWNFLPFTPGLVGGALYWCRSILFNLLRRKIRISSASDFSGAKDQRLYAKLRG